MIEWGAPWAFILVLPVLLIPFQHRLTGVNRLAVASTAHMERRWTPRLLLAPLPASLRLVGGLLIAAALARPQTITREISVESEGLDILVAIDTSGSMKQEDFRVGGRAVNRLQVAKSVLRDFVEGRPYDRIGLVVFGENAYTHVPLTLDHGSLLAAMDGTQIGSAGSAGTAIGTAIAVGAKRLKDLEAPGKLVILLTDGQNNAGRVDPMQAADACAALDIKVYTIGVGGKGGFFQQLLSDGIDEALLRRIADLTQAKYYRATDTRTLQGIFSEIDELEPSPAEVEELVEQHEKYRIFLIPGIFLLILDLLLSTTLLRRWP